MNIVSKGLKANDELYGNSDHDTLKGGLGDDYMWGGTGNDRLFGETEDDYIWGGEGDDLLNGNVGYDVLTGNEGTDTFVLTPGEGVDIITDFEVDSDTLKFHDGINPEQLSINQMDTNTVIELTEETLAILINTNANELMAANDFI